MDFGVYAPFQKWNRLAICAAIALSISALSTLPTKAQDQRACLLNVANLPSVYIDSFANDVFVNGRPLKPFTEKILLCPGDEVGTGATGRVAIRFDDKRTIIRLDGDSTVRIPSGGPGKADVSLISGILYFLSSVRRRFQVDTPYIVAGIEGTEALVAADPDQRLAMTAVRQGLVSAYSKQEGPDNTLLVEEGEAAYTSASVKFQKAPIGALPRPFRELLIVSDSAVDWAVYYPPILLVPDVKNRAVRNALVLMSSGDYEQAAAVLRSAANAEPSATAALRAIIDVGRNRLEAAQRWSELALNADPDFAPAHVAASYVRQANGDLKSALEFARQAAKIAPNDAYALARLAELQMTIGDRRAALDSARRSLAVARTPLALFVAGLANLVAVDYAKAEEQFREAIRLDPEAPLPRLGLGLAFIRRGDIAAGAWEIERALAHDPRRAALRTWLGRAYFDEGFTKKAADEFRLSKKEDPNDSRPYLFSALERFAANRPIQALDDVLEAEKRGAGRRVLRSERGLGEDTAARGAALGRLFDILNFGQLAIVEGSKASDADPSNPGAHRFLADVYRSLPGLSISQTSELLRSQLLSPPSTTPVQPQLAEARLALLDTTGPSRVAFAEFSPLFDTDGLRFDAAGLFGTQKTRSAEGAVTGLYRNASLSIGQFHYETDGYHENNDLSHDIFDVVTKVALSPEFSFFGEYRRRESEGGDRRLNFNINDFAPNVRTTEERSVARLGFHIQPSNASDVIGVYTRASLSTETSDEFFGLPITASDDEDAHSGQIQYLRDDGNLRSVIGGGYIHNNVAVSASIGGFPIPAIRFDADYFNTYAYFFLQLPARVTWTLGGSAVSYEESDGAPDIFEFHPKIGATVELNDHITLRAAYLRNLKPNLVSEQTIEPTTIAGFSQSFDAFDGSILEQVGGGVDIKLNDGFWIGGEAIGRWWDVPVSGAPNAETMEWTYRAYFNTVLWDHMALSAEIRHERSESNDAPFDFEEWQTTSVPVTLSYFDDSGIFGSVRAEYVDHSFSNPGDSGTDAFTIVTTALGYRLPKNKGIVSIEVQNLFDTKFNFQNRSIRPDLTATPRFAPERTILARGTLKF